MVTSDYRLEYTSPDKKHVLRLDPNATEGPFMLMPTPGGLLSPSVSFNSRKAPSQPGTTLTDTVVGNRGAPVQFAVIGSTPSEYWKRRSLAAAALAVPPSRIGTLPPQGVLRLFRPGQPIIQTRALPRNPNEAGRPDRMSLIVDVEFVSHDPYWSEENIRSVVMRADGGFEFPLEHPWESVANNVVQDVVNEGSVQTPIIARLYGEFTGGRLINETTGEMLEYTGAVAADDYVEINTAFGNKTVTYVAADGTRTKDMGGLNLLESSFWSLLRGTNRIRFEADVNTSGWANLLFQQRHGGA